MTFDLFKLFNQAWLSRRWHMKARILKSLWLLGINGKAVHSKSHDSMCNWDRDKWGYVRFVLAWIDCAVFRRKKIPHKCHPSPGSGQGSGTTELPSGRHTFPFQFQLPQGLPSSFEAVTGHVRYQVKCKIDKPWKFDHKTKRAFTVISILDLNQNAAYCVSWYFYLVVCT